MSKENEYGKKETCARCGKEKLLVFGSQYCALCWKIIKRWGKNGG